MLRRSSKPKKYRQSAVPQSIKNLILNLRKAHPTYGKMKIHTILCRDHAVSISESTVGRILKDFMESGIIQKYQASCYKKRRRKFNKHAKRWSYDLRPKQPGEMIQIDHMSVSINQIGVKHFQAWDPITKFVHAQLFSNAKATSAFKFLEELQEVLPFPICSIQVDGGSEFMAEFEEACQKKKIPLFVLPPKSPQKNGGVERTNRTMRDDLYDPKYNNADSIGALRFELKKALKIYNTFRPHQAIGNQTPMSYTQNILKAA